MNTATEIMIDGRPVKFRASAATPRFYRLKFGRDLFADLKKIEVEAKADDLAPEARDTIERVAWTMARQADEAVPEDVTAWLDEFSPLAIFAAAPQIFELWGCNLKQISTAKKKSH